ncbi:MAG: hypothetical protein LQ338_006536 [Usnochroma carphineum]|nr:MAG: hypothetical protein LQ338_006536 [Usnochroma carphineum]
MKFSAAALASASFASVVAGQGCASQKPVGDNPSGNPIHAPLSQIVPAGTPFTVVWTNTTTGFVNIELLRGPSTNVVPIQCLADHIPNTGKYVWTPSPSLQADVTHYGLRIVVSGTGQFQYSNQFGISNDVVHPPSSSLSPTTQQQQQQYPATTVKQASDGQLQVPTSSPSKPATTTAPSTTSSVPIIANTNSTITTSSAIASTPVANSSVIIATTHVPIPVVPSGSGGSSGRPYTQTALQPTNNMTVPASLQTSKKTPLPTKVTASASASVVVSSSSGTGSPIASATGSGAPSSGAGKVVAGGLVAAVGAVAAFVLL